ncbi:MAG: S-layer homology domain-containing protein [Candidatus Gastranaerophilales bacterium]|nr:S-layer homology domain-containing protein [Candidatus Gastranaerophilales bacterium]
MTIKKRLVLGATTTFCALALTVPMSFAACPVTSDCSRANAPIVTPDNATCSKCKQNPCCCEKKKNFFSEMFSKKDDCGCQTGAAAPCGCEEKKDDCSCEKKQNDCGCTGAAAPCIETKPLNQQTYAYPNAIYSHSNQAQVGESLNGAEISDSLLVPSHRGASANCACTGAAVPVNPGVPVECECITGGAAPIINADDLPKYNCNAAPNVYSTNTMDIIKVTKEPCSCFGFTGAAADVTSQQYPDVFNSYWAASDINRLTEQCVLEGYPDGMFKPNRKVSRAEMATMVVKGYNLDVTSNCDALTFKDVPRSHWAHDYISKGVSEDMIAGMANNKFYPDKHITRTEALTIMAKGINCPMDDAKANEILSQYKDGSSVPCWAKQHVAKAIENGALKNERNQDFIRPNDKTTRAEASSMLQGMRLAGGYDKSTKTATQDLGGKTFVEKEQKVTIPTLTLTMNDVINAKHANVGEQFSATTQNEITINGQTFPCGSTVRGKIVEVTRPSKNCKGNLRLSFNQIINDGCKMDLPQQILTAQVQRKKEINGVLRLVQLPFTWAGSIIGTAGRTIGGAAIGISNAAEALLDQTGVGTSELLGMQFKAAGRSYQDGLKTIVKAPIDLTRTAISGTMGLFQTTGDEVAYLVDPSGNPISKVNPKECVTIAFGYQGK